MGRRNRLIRPAIGDTVIKRFSLLVATLLFAGLTSTPAWSVPVENLYGATVPLEDGSSKALDRGFERALSQVLVKVTGLPDAASPEFRSTRFPTPADLVQRYSKLSGSRLQVSLCTPVGAS